jgi:hypothetical protein
VSFLGVSPIGALAAGWVSERIGPPRTLAACGLLAVTASIVYALQYPRIRREMRAAYDRLGLVSGPGSSGRSSPNP